MNRRLPSTTHNVPSSTKTIFELAPDLKALYAALRRRDQLIFDEFFAAIEQYKDVINNTTDWLPIEILPWLISLQEHERIDRAFDPARERLERIKNKLDELESPQQP